MPVYELAVSNSIVFEIDPRIELLAGVQSQTKWITDSRGSEGGGNSYYRALSAYFAPFKNHPAAKSSASLMRTGFTYDAPPAFALSTEGGAAFRSPTRGWSDYLAGRAGIFLRALGRNRLDRFALELSDLWEKSAFEQFLGAHEAEYKRWLLRATEGYDWARLSSWFAEFYGANEIPTVFHFVLAPAMFPGGGYGFSREERSADGTVTKFHVYQIIRAEPSGAETEPDLPARRRLALLALHEFSHSWVNPALEQASAKRAYQKALNTLFKPVAEKMGQMAYGSIPVFLNELFVRAASILGAYELGIYDELGMRMAILDEVSQGFYPMARAVRLLQEYQKARQLYPNFASYAEVIVQTLVAEAPELLASRAEAGLTPVSSLEVDFDELHTLSDLMSAFTVEIGSGIYGGSGYGSTIELISEEARPGFVRLRADSGTSTWYALGREVLPKAGKLVVSYKARGSGIVTDPGQYGGSFVGFITTDKSGNRAFTVQYHKGSFGWSDYRVELMVNPAKIRSIELLIFLNESGQLDVDGLSLAYDQ